MKNTDVYFEDIFFPVKILWKKKFPLTYGNLSKTFVVEIREDYNRVEFIIDVEKSYMYNDWHGMMYFVMYQVITRNGLTLLDQGKQNLNLDDISVEEFEEKFLENLLAEGNEKYLKKYRRLKG